MTYANSTATADGFRKSGASALLSRYRGAPRGGDRVRLWPWPRREKRESGGDFSDAVVRLIEAQAAGTAADAASTAARRGRFGSALAGVRGCGGVGDPLM